jgi:protein JSN1
MAAVITLHSVRLATNANGALLLTWLLDTCNFPNRFKTLAPRLVTHLVKLCTHKLASLTVLKLINQRSEPEARDIILNALFSPDEENKVLKRILEDQVHGAAVIYKILTSPFVADQGSAERRAQMTSLVRSILQKLKVQSGQGYKRLMDEVGLADRTVQTPPLNGHRGPQRSTTPREYGAPGQFAPGQFYSPQHAYQQQQYIPQQPIDIMSRGQIDPTLLGMDISPAPIYSPQHQAQDPASAYQYQQMMMLQPRAYNTYNAQQSQQLYQTSGAQHNQFGGPLLPAQNLNVYGMNGAQGYQQYPGDAYNNRQRR